MGIRLARDTDADKKKEKKIYRVSRFSIDRVGFISAQPLTGNDATRRQAFLDRSF